MLTAIANYLRLQHLCDIAPVFVLDFRASKRYNKLQYVQISGVPYVIGGAQTNLSDMVNNNDKTCTHTYRPSVFGSHNRTVGETFVCVCLLSKLVDSVWKISWTHWKMLPGAMNTLGVRNIGTVTERLRRFKKNMLTNFPFTSIHSFSTHHDCITVQRISQAFKFSNVTRQV